MHIGEAKTIVGLLALWAESRERIVSYGRSAAEQEFDAGMESGGVLDYIAASLWIVSEDFSADVALFPELIEYEVLPCERMPDGRMQVREISLKGLERL